MSSPAMVVLITACLSGMCLHLRCGLNLMSVAGLAWSLVYRQTFGATVYIILRMIFRQSSFQRMRTVLTYRRLSFVISRRGRSFIPHLKSSPPLPILFFINR